MVLDEDLEHILDHTREIWNGLRNENLFVTGGTGWFGCWLLESFVYANKRLGLGATAVVLTRNPDAFAHKAPHLAVDPSIKLRIGDANETYFHPEDFKYLIHAEVENLDTMPEEARRIFEFSSYHDVHSFLYISSGAVGHPNKGFSTYGIQKKKCEDLFLAAFRQEMFPIKIARPYTFVGPYMPLDIYAIGKFIKQGLTEQRVVVRGGENIVRSYLYMSDLWIWLWSILFEGTSGTIYPVGSPYPITILDVARTVAETMQVPFDSYKIHQNPDVYVPDVVETQTALGVDVYVSLVEAIEKTIRWFR